MTGVPALPGASVIKSLRVKVPWLFQNQFNTIYWEVWLRLMTCIGDFVDVVDSTAESVSVQNGITSLMDERAILSFLTLYEGTDELFLTKKLLS